MKVVNQSAQLLVPESPMKHIERIGRICYKSEDKVGEGTDKKFVKMLFDHDHHAMLEHYRFIMMVNPTIYELLEGVDHSHVQMTHCTVETEDRYVISMNARALINLVEDSNAEHHGVLPMAVRSVRDELIGHIIKKYDCYELFGIPREFTHILSTGVDFIENSPYAMTRQEWDRHGWASVHMITDRGISHEIVRHREETSFAQESTRYCNYNKDKFGKEITVIDQGFEKESNEYICWRSATMVAEDMYFEMLTYGVKPEFARSVLPTCLKTEIVMTAPMFEWDHFFDLRMYGVAGTPHPLIKELSTMACKSIDGGLK